MANNCVGDLEPCGTCMTFSRMFSMPTIIPPSKSETLSGIQQYEFRIILKALVRHLAVQIVNEERNTLGLINVLIFKASCTN